MDCALAIENQEAVGNMKEFMNSHGFGSELKDATQPANYQFQGGAFIRQKTTLGAKSRGVICSI